MRQAIKKNRSVTAAQPFIYTLVLDMNNIMKISLVNHKTNEKGVVCGMVTSALRLIGEVLKKKDFDYCIAAYDGYGSGVLRYRIYEDYKANRDKHYELIGGDTEYDRALNAYRRKVLEHANAKRKGSSQEDDDELFAQQKPILQSILEELCIRQYEFENVEGDDIISYYVHNKKPNEKIVIVSSDKDITQLISETVIVYNPRTKAFVTMDNSVEQIGVRCDNVVLEKMICGDPSDNIKGVKGIGEATLHKLFPEINARRLDLEAVVARSKELLDERKAQKKKPLRALENIVNGITDGCQGDRLYEINRKIIDLSEPMLTDEARRSLADELYAPMDTTDKSVKNIYKIFSENNMRSMVSEDIFGLILGPFERIMAMERKRFERWIEETSKKC